MKTLKSIRPSSLINSVLLLLMVVGLAACKPKNEQPAKTQDAITIGMLAPLTGPGAVGD
jgi:uncharacterized lipoprotein